MQIIQGSGYNKKGGMTQEEGAVSQMHTVWIGQLREIVEHTIYVPILSVQILCALPLCAHH